MRHILLVRTSMREFGTKLEPETPAPPATTRWAYLSGLEERVDAYVDLRPATDQRDLRQAALAIQAVIESRGARNPILAEGHSGPRMSPVRGLPIYFPPFRDPSAFYRELDFARRTRWAEFLETYLANAR